VKFLSPEEITALASAGGMVDGDVMFFVSDMAADRSEIVTFARDDQFPSDHCPVVAKLRLGTAP
jgi:exonuclease III